jgi:hypothetical protein
MEWQNTDGNSPIFGISTESYQYGYIGHESTGLVLPDTNGRHDILPAEEKKRISSTAKIPKNFAPTDDGRLDLG